MTTNSDLANWGEPPATPEEETLARLAQEVVEAMQRGEPVKPACHWRGTDVVTSGEEFADTISWIQHFAASVGERSGLFGVSDAMPGSADTPLPDPFPGEFLLITLLGEGAFAKVWLADDLYLDRQ